MPEPVAAQTKPASAPLIAAEALAARLDRLRARGADTLDVLGWALIEALSRRVGHSPVRAQAAIARRLAHALEALEARLECAAVASPAASAHDEGVASPLATLLAALGDAPPLPGGAAQPRELKAVRDFRRSWTRLHRERQLAQALTQAPENAGPLNSQHLLLQAMTRLKALSPDYLEAFIGYADALLWLEQAGTMLEATKKEPARAAAKSLPPKSASKRPAQAARTRRTKTLPGAES